MYTEASARAVKKYVKKTYHRTTIRFRKEEFLEIKNYLEDNDISINSFIVEATKEKYQRLLNSKDK